MTKDDFIKAYETMNRLEELFSEAATQFNTVQEPTRIHYTFHSTLYSVFHS